jgi:prolipoprotein diacylglyceryltransferase
MILCYAVGRFFLEFFRGDATRGIYGGIALSQYISLMFIPMCVYLIFWLSRHKRLPENQYGVTPAPAPKPGIAKTKKGAKKRKKKKLQVQMRTN